jgi:hypothetical protein
MRPKPLLGPAMPDKKRHLGMLEVDLPVQTPEASGAITLHLIDPTSAITNGCTLQCVDPCEGVGEPSCRSTTARLTKGYWA